MATDQGVVCDNIGHDAMLLHLLENLQCLLRPLALLQGTDQGVVGDNIGHYAMLLHALDKL